MKSFLLCFSILAWLHSTLAASLQQVTGFSPNPTNTLMYIYVPDRLPTTPRAILVAMHYCSGTAQAFYTGTGFARLADQYGFIVIYPQAPPGSPGPNCWDVATQATLRHDAGGDSLGISSMVAYTISRYNGDANRVYAMGHSSGGMMSNVLAGSYPNLFKAIAPSAGVPFACFAGSSWWNSDCAGGRIIRTGQQWGDLVRAAYPGYTGARPRMQIWHGTNDETLNFQNFQEEIKQWTNVLGVSETPTTTENNFYRQGWTRFKYGTQVEAIRGQGQPHNIEVVATEIIKFFGLDQNATVPSTTVGSPPSTTLQPPPSTTAQPPPPSTTSSPPQPTQPLVPKWGQCGGIGWTGGTQCVAGTTCTRLNDWYYQCL